MFVTHGHTVQALGCVKWFCRSNSTAHFHEIHTNFGNADYLNVDVCIFLNEQNTYKLAKTFLEQLYYNVVLPKKSTEGKVFKSKKKQ